MNFSRELRARPTKPKSQKHAITDTRFFESFCGSPPNFSFTKSPILKPAPGRISLNTVPLATLTSLLDRPLLTRKRLGMRFSWHPFSCRAAIERSLKNFAGLGGGYRRISPLCPDKCLLISLNIIIIHIRWHKIRCYRPMQSKIVHPATTNVH